MASEERLRELEEKYEGYTVYDNGGSKIGKVDDLFVDESDSEEYIGVKMGFFGSKSTLIPIEIVRVNEGDRTIEVAESKDRVKDAPSFSDDDEVTGEYEERIRSHFGLKSLGSGSGRGSYGSQSNEGDSTAGSAGSVAAAGAASGTSDQDSSYSTGEPGSSGQNTRGETYGSSGAAATDSTGAAGHQESEGSSSSSGSQPTTTRQTEETETFQEDGRTKIRRRIIREEIVDADDQGTTS